jgi:hypothetical protein
VNESALQVYQCAKHELVGLTAEEFCKKYNYQLDKISGFLEEAWQGQPIKLEWEGKTPSGQSLAREIV